jgi:hypothetical protein
MPIGEHPQDRHMIIGSYSSQTAMTQRRDRGGQRVVGIVLRRLTRAQHPHPRRQRRRDINHVLAGSDELLGEEIAEPVGRLDRPPPLVEP